jgi:multidrug resistance efflux pump
MEYMRMNYYPQKILLKQKMDKRQEELQNHRKKEFFINEQQKNLAEKIYQRDSLLHIKNIGTQEDYEHALQTYLQSKQTAISNETMKRQLEMQNMQDRETLLDLEQQYSQTKNQSALALHTAAEQLKMSIDTWMENYVLRSPISGTVNLMGIWSQTQNVSSGEQVFVVIPDKPQAPIGAALLPVSGAGKVKQGQKVEVRVNNFPDQEFGYLTGSVENVSEIPDKDNHYLVRINFPNGLITNYGRRLPISKQMIGSAEIIVENKRLLERLIFGSSQKVEKLKTGGKNSDPT